MSNLIILTLYVRNFILKLYVETVTVGLDTFPHCETRNRPQSLFSAYLSVPHTFATLNSQLKEVRLSQLKFMFMCHFALI
jgi:hypothetical protein